MSDKNSPKDDKDMARKPRGFPDRRELILNQERALIDKVTAVYRQWGFEHLETGAFEYTDALGKFLPDTDRPNEGVFSILDEDHQWMSLRYDLTAPLARFVAENYDKIPKPFRRYAAGPVWRNEKPGPGRFREFLQCDADSIGVPGAEADAEMIAMAATAMEACGFEAGEYAIRVNTREILNGVLDLVGASKAETRLTILRALDKLDRLGSKGVADLLGSGRKDESGDFTEGAGLDAQAIETVLSFANAGTDTRDGTMANLEKVAGASEEGQKGLQTLIAIDKALKAMGVSEDQAIFDPSVVRGLEYYTGPVYEAELLTEVRDEKNRPVRFGSVGGGGRYDDLVSRFRGELVPATGFSVGVSRLVAAMTLKQSKSDEVARTGPILVLVMDKEEIASSLAIVSELRAAGMRAEMYLGASGMRAQMKYADRRLSPAVVIEGSEERERGVLQVKDLAEGQKQAASIDDNAKWRTDRPGQFEVPRNEIVAALKSITA